MIEISNYNLYPSYASFTLSIDEEKKNIILFVNLSDDEKDKFGQVISGISYQENAMHNGQNLFDNKKYFESRIYLDSKFNYFKTLDEKKISEKLLNNYGEALKEDKLKELIHDLNIRSNFKNKKIEGISKDLFCLSLALSTFNNAIININDYSVLKEKTIIEEINKFNNGLTLLVQYDNSLVNKNILNGFDFVYFVYIDKAQKFNISEIDKYFKDVVS